MKDVKFRIGLWVIGFALSLVMFSPVIKQGGAVEATIISVVVGVLFAVALTGKWSGERVV